MTAIPWIMASFAAARVLFVHGFAAPGGEFATPVLFISAVRLIEMEIGRRTR